MTDLPFSRLRGALSAAVTLLAFVIVVPSVPVVLAIVVGLPIPRPFTTSTVFAERGLFDLVVLLVWFLWAIHVVLLARATVTQLRHREATENAAPRYINRLAVRLAGACMVVATVVTGASLSSGAATVRPAVAASAPVTAEAVGPIPTPTAVAPTATSAVASAPDAPSAPAPAPLPATYTVEAGQSLWAIAQQLYGSGEDWQLLAGANLGRTMDDGLVFVDPNLIYAGWQLIVPAVADPAPSTPATTPAPVPGPPPAPSATTPITSSSEGHSATSDSGAGTAPHHRARPAVASHPAVAAHADDPHRLDLPELAGLGFGALCAAVLFAAAVRSRRLSRRARRTGQRLRPRSESTATVEADLAAFAQVPLPDLLTYGLSHLRAALAGAPQPAPRVRLLRLGPDGLTLVLDERRDEAPGAFLSGADGYAWVLPATLDVARLPGAVERDPWLPSLVPAGESAQGTFLVPVEPGTIIPLAGPNAGAVVAAMTAVAQAWTWAGDRLLVVRNPDEATRAVELVGDPERTGEHSRVLYFGDPSLLDPPVRRRLGVVTTEAVMPSDVRLVCDPNTTTVEPFGLTLVPEAISDEVAAALGELAEPPAAESTETVAPVTEPVPVAGPAEGPTMVRFPDPAPIKVRVLTPVPRIEGAAGTPPEHREARAVEMLAYLALHGHAIPPYEVRAEALTTRSGEGSAHTLRLVASGLRQWIGVAHLPHAERSGGYRAENVSTDLGRLEAAVKQAAAVSDPDHVIDLLRPALSLIEGVPASRVGMGWGWWGPQFEAHAGDLATDAASVVAPLLAERGDGRGARWAIDQARILDPYNESLYRLAIECAASVGNAAWIDRELQGCEAMIEDLYPGATPTPETYDAYHAAMAQFSAAPGTTGSS